MAPYSKIRFIATSSCWCRSQMCVHLYFVSMTLLSCYGTLVLPLILQWGHMTTATLSNPVDGWRAARADRMLLRVAWGSTRGLRPPLCTPRVAGSSPGGGRVGREGYVWFFRSTALTAMAQVGATDWPVVSASTRGTLKPRSNMAAAVRCYREDKRLQTSLPLSYQQCNIHTLIKTNRNTSLLRYPLPYLKWRERRVSGSSSPTLLRKQVYN